MLKNHPFKEFPIFLILGEFDIKKNPLKT